MIKKILIMINISLTISLFSSITIPDSKPDLPFDLDNKSSQINEKKITSPLFSFKIGNIPGSLVILGSWNIKLGFGAGFVLYPELMFLANVPDMKEGIVFEQERLFALDWTTENGIDLRLFFNDDLEQSELTFKYQVGKIFKSIYITNKFSSLKINPYRTLKGGKVSDINIGFDWGHKMYAGRFDLQFDSAKKVNDSFKGNNRYIENKIYSSSYLRGVYYYLPDKNITGEIIVYLSDDNGEKIDNLPEDFKEARKYKKIEEGREFKIDPEEGTIVFNEPIHGKTLLINYKTKINSNIYEVGDINCGIKGVYGTTDFNEISNKDYFVRIGEKRFLILSFLNKYSHFEEKNSYKIAGKGINVKNLNIDIFDDKNIKTSGFNYFYDDYTGCLRIVKNNDKKTLYYIYPFFDSVTDKNFYLNNVSPKDREAKNSIRYEGIVGGNSLTLSQKPVNGSISVFVNSTEIESKYYSYDYIDQSVNLSFEVNENDTIDIYYIADENDAYNLTASLKNDFKLGNYIMLSDSFWYKMPIKLWENSFYNKLHCAEFIYDITLNGNFRRFLADNKNGKLNFNSSVSLSLFIPELKGITIIEDFETEKKGYSLDLDYKNYFPVSLPKNIYPALSTAKYGKLFFRNTHNLGITTNGNYISLYDSPPEKEEYQPDGRIGPYSSCDGYYGEKNSLSLVTEFELKENEGVSVALPINNLEYDPTAFSQIVAAIKSLDLTGNVWVYFDGGLISERFNENETVLQKETLDEGIKYLIDGKYYLYKGRNDGRNQTNDFDNNGILDDDDPDNITSFKYFKDFDNSSDMLSLEAGESKIANFRIVNPDKLKDSRGLRLTLYSPTGAKGKLIINQIRFTESGFTQDKGKNSFAEEIFPAEDDILVNNIFSQKNKDFDSRLHFQRDKERTLRVRLKSGEDFSFSKKYSVPIDVSYFKKFGFFIFLKNISGKTLKTTLIDSRGNEMIKKINLLNYQNNKWHNIENEIRSFENYAYSNKTITQIKFEFINENGIDVFDNDIFIDEIYMQESETFAGFANKNEFIYEDPKAELKTKEGFSIFSAPRLKIGTLFNSQNFLKEETRPEKNFILNIDSILSFKFVTMDFYAASNLDVFFSERVYNPNEIFNLKLVRNADKTLPLLFGFIYDYDRSGVVDQAGLITLDTKNENRKLSLYLGFKVDRASLKFDYDVDTQKKDINYNNNKYAIDFRFNFEKINVGLFYNIFSKKKRDILNGDNSFQNLGYLFSEDFASFYYKSDEKYQYLNLKSNFDLIPNVNFTNSLEYRDSGTKMTNDFAFNAKYYNKSAIDVKINYLGATNSFFYFEYSRNLENSYSKEYSSIAWEDYFYNFGNNFNSLTPIFFYPPFSSIYKKGGKTIFGEDYRFSSLRDAAGLYFDWSLFLSKRFFLPYRFRFDFIESVSNSLFYKSDYTLTLSLKGEGEVSTNYIKNLNASYFINQTVTLKSFEKIFKTEINFNLNFYLYNNIDLENNISYFLNYSEGITKKEFNHNISFYTKFYKDFYKKNHITEDKEGLDLTVVINFLSNFYHRLDKQSDMISSPLRIYLAPQIGYRFNKNFTLKGTTKFGYNLEYGEILNVFKNSFACEVYVEGILSF